MLSYRLILAILPVIFIFIKYGSAIECYSCRSEDDPSCESGTPDAKFLKNCSTIKNGPKYTACRKMENWVDFKVLDQKPIRRIIRQCAADVDRDRPCYYRAGFGGRANVCDCFEDKCNSASIPMGSLFLTALTAFFFFKFSL